MILGVCQLDLPVSLSTRRSLDDEWLRSLHFVRRRVSNQKDEGFHPLGVDVLYRDSDVPVVEVSTASVSTTPCVGLSG